MLTIKVSNELYAELSLAITEGRYTNMTTAVTEALENELRQPSRQDNDSVLQALRHNLDIIQTAYDGTQRLIEEKDKRIEDLTKEVEMLNMFAHYFKNVEVKQIGVPAEKKKPFWKFW
jgi:Arc/MetJ-type ribon-helix-helix transcriptional regulator